MPGLRAGWLVGPSQLVKHAEALSMCMLFGLPGFIQEAAITAIEESGAAESRIREFCRTRRDMLLAALDGTPGIRCSVPDAGMFTLVDVRATGLTGNEFMHGLYRAERVSVIDGGAFGAETRGFVRLCFATDEATLSEAVIRIRRYAAALTR
jgi:arginine:pyruvate transaminase